MKGSFPHSAQAHSGMDRTGLGWGFPSTPLLSYDLGRTPCSLGLSLLILMCRRSHPALKFGDSDPVPQSSQSGRQGGSGGWNATLLRGGSRAQRVICVL